jgi:hypothetical protein
MQRIGATNSNTIIAFARDATHWRDERQCTALHAPRAIHVSPVQYRRFNKIIVSSLRGSRFAGHGGDRGTAVQVPVVLKRFLVLWFCDSPRGHPVLLFW